MRNLLIVIIASMGLFVQPVAWAQPNSSPVPGSSASCPSNLCSASNSALSQYAAANNCLPGFLNPAQTCQTSADLFYKAIMQQETSINPTIPSASNNFLPGRNGEPASPGKPVSGTPYYSASYGPTQLTMGTLMPTVEKLIKSNTDCTSTPTCVAPFVTNVQVKTALLSWDHTAKIVQNTVCAGACKAGQPVAIPGSGVPTFPTFPVTANSPITQSMWDRIAAWNYVSNQIYQAHHNGKYTTGYQIGTSLLTNPDFIQMLNYLGMRYELKKSYPQPTILIPNPVYHAYRDTVNNYINYGPLFYNLRPAQYSEARASFQTGVFFTSPQAAASPGLYNNLLGSVFSVTCNQYFSMAIFPTMDSQFGSSGSLSQQDKWVKKVAGKWNGSGAHGNYAKSVVKIYNGLVNQYLANNHVTSMPATCPGDVSTTNTCVPTTPPTSPSISIP